MLLDEVKSFLDVHVESLYSREKWYASYHREFSDSFVPRFRQFYRDLRDCLNVADPVVRDVVSYTCSNALANLWRYELYSLQYRHFLIEFGRYVADVDAQYAAVVGKKIGSSWRNNDEIRSFPNCF